MVLMVRLRRTAIRCAGALRTIELPFLALLMLALVTLNFTLLAEDKGRALEDNSGTPELALGESYEERRVRLRKFCAEHGEEVANISRVAQAYSWILWIYPYNFTYCLIPKIGSTFWLRSIANAFPGFKHSIEVAGKSWFHKHMVEQLGLPITWKEENRRKVVQRTFSIVFIRHPFLKLVSSFQDKIIDMDRVITVRSVVLEAQRNLSLPTDQPSFEVFVRLLLDGSVNNPHFSRLFEFNCDFCRIDYSMIGKMETMARDLLHIRSMTGFGNVEDFHHREHASSGGFTVGLAKSYFQQLPKDLIRKLYNHFKYDFEAFGYDDADYYIDLGRD